MSKIINLSCRHVLFYCKNLKLHQKAAQRTFLSNAYYCEEVWNSRLKTPILEKVDLDELYHELETGYTKTNNISAVDVDIFANAVQTDSHVDELLDLVHKLRLSAETGNSLQSTEHAVIRCLSNFGLYDRLLHILDDRLNYGVFLDSYTANLLLDTFWKKKDYASGARVASQIMLQEDFSHPLVTNLSLLHCYKFLQKPEGWTEPEPEEEPKEEVKVRVKFIRNPYFDNHFDLKNPIQIVGKTIAMAGSTMNDSLGKSFKLVGLTLQKDIDKAKQLLNEYKNETLVAEVINLLPEDNEIKGDVQQLKTESVNVEQILETKVKEAERFCVEKDISERCNMYDEWLKRRQDALEKQQKRLEVAERLETIEDSQAKLKQKELQLW